MDNKLKSIATYIIGILSGVVTIVFLSLPLLVYWTNMAGNPIFTNGTLNAFEMLVGFKCFARSTSVVAGVFALLSLILALFIIVSSIMQILKVYGKFDWKLDTKLGDFNMWFDAFTSLLAVFAFGVYLCTIFYKAKNVDTEGYTLVSTPNGICLFVIPAVLSIACWVIDAVKEAQAKKLVEVAKDADVKEDKAE